VTIRSTARQQEQIDPAGRRQARVERPRIGRVGQPNVVSRNACSEQDCVIQAPLDLALGEPPTAVMQVRRAIPETVATRYDVLVHHDDHEVGQVGPGNTGRRPWP